MVLTVLLFPIESMYGIFTYIWLIFMVNLGKYAIDGSYGLPLGGVFVQSFPVGMLIQQNLFATVEKWDNLARPRKWKTTGAAISFLLVNATTEGFPTAVVRMVRRGLFKESRTWAQLSAATKKVWVGNCSETEQKNIKSDLERSRGELLGEDVS